MRSHSNLIASVSNNNGIVGIQQQDHLLYITQTPSHQLPAANAVYLMDNNQYRYQYLQPQIIVFASNSSFPDRICGIQQPQPQYINNHSNNTQIPSTPISPIQIPEITTLEVHECNICKKQFKHKTNLTTHKRLHSSNCPKCEFCGKRFARPSNLAQHRRIHTKEKPYKCSICNKSYRQKHSLKDHERIHSGEKPFKCDLCDKAFNIRHNMVTHRRVHTGEKPYQCHLCDKRFSSKSGQNSHLKHRHKIVKK